MKQIALVLVVCVLLFVMLAPITTGVNTSTVISHAATVWADGGAPAPPFPPYPHLLITWGDGGAPAPPFPPYPHQG